MNKNKMLGGLYGLVLGDACGVPYEFQNAKRLPPVNEISFTPATFSVPFSKTYPNVPWGTWSDDTSLALCLLDALVPCEPTTWEHKFVSNMIKWRFDGLFAVDGRKFDIGMQTGHALLELENGVQISDRSDPDAYGNGALMRSLPASLVVPLGRDTLTEYISRRHVPATHANDVCLVTSIAYGWWANRLLQGVELTEALSESLDMLSEYEELSEAYKLLLAHEHKECTGSGFVVDTFWSTYYALKRGTDFRSTIQHAISLGNDTDTTACVAGGLAGIVYGFDNLPTDWLESLRGRDVIDMFAAKLIDYHGLNDE